LSGSIAPGQYYLVQEAVGAGGTTNPPTPDATGTIAMSATNAKVALVNVTTPLSGSCPTSITIVDLIGYGTGTSQPSCFEGAPAPTRSNTTSTPRNSSGCVDTDNNGADFSSGAVSPRNSASPANSCGLSTNPTGTGVAAPSTVTAGGQSTLTVNVTPG